MEKQAQNLINLYNELGEKHGYWEEYFYDGQICSKGNFVNGRKNGYWEYHSSNGQLSRKGNWVNGKFHEEKPVTELTMDEIAKKFGIPVNQLKIKKE
jgi:antitoxin component YwqK of YwqJK toxin-antitoxin module